MLIRRRNCTNGVIQSRAMGYEKCQKGVDGGSKWKAGMRETKV